jgi:sugar O-acyltransferase (sialic acid O-acetyltransferase NeuD family)
VNARVVVIGGSDQGRQTIDVLEEHGDVEVIGVLDRTLPTGTVVAGYSVLGTDADLARCARENDATAFVVAVGDNSTRARLFAAARAAAPDLEPLRAVHPRAVIARSAVVGPGVTVMAGAVVANHCTIGTGALIGTNASIDHDGVLADFASLGPGATTGGHVSVGECTAVGLGAAVIHGVTIGAHTVIGAGALVLDDLPELVVAYGAPARVVRARRPGDPYLQRS